MASTLSASITIAPEGALTLNPLNGNNAHGWVAAMYLGYTGATLYLTADDLRTIVAAGTKILEDLP